MGQEQELKWRIQDELRKVPMKTPAKALVWDLLSRVDPATGVIPARHTPSLSDLADSTCMGRSTVARYMNGLEATGWMVRERPSVADALNQGRRTQYRLAIGSFDLPPELKHEKQKRKPKKDESTLDSPAAGLSKRVKTVQDGPGAGPSEQVETGHDSPGAGPSKSDDGPGAGSSMVPERDSDSPGAGHNKEPLTEVLSSSVHQSSSPPSGGDADAPPPDTLFDLDDDSETEPPPADDKPKPNVVLADWIDFLKTKNIKLTDRVRGHYAKVIEQVIDQGFSERVIKQALARMLERDQHGAPSQLENFIVDVQKKPTAPAPKGPKSTAPARLDKSEKCEEHRRPLPCGLCRADQLGKKKTNAAS